MSNTNKSTREGTQHLAQQPTQALIEGASRLPQGRAISPVEATTIAPRGFVNLLGGGRKRHISPRS